MGNLFADLPLPVLNGPGAAVNTSGMGSPKTIEVVGNFHGAGITVEASVDGGAAWGPVTTFTNVGGQRVVEVAAELMRVRVSGRKTSVPFAANCDVGAPDAGSLFALIPMPVLNGPGAGVNVSSFGTRCTFVAGGEFPGATILVEISEDGVAWAPLLSFSGQGDLRSSVVTAAFVRANVSGRTPARPFSGTLAMGAANDGGSATAGATSCCLEFKPDSGEAGPVVFEDFDELYAALDAARLAAPNGGCYEILFNDEFAPCVIPATQSYDMTQTKWVGKDDNTAPPLQTIATFAVDAAVTNLREIVHLTLVATDGSATPPISDLSYGDIFYLTDDAGLAGDGALVMSIDPGSFKSATIELRHGSSIGTGASVISFDGDATSTLVVNVDKFSRLEPSSIDASVGGTLLLQLEGMTNIPASAVQPGFVGTIAVQSNPSSYNLNLIFSPGGPAVVGAVNRVVTGGLPTVVSLAPAASYPGGVVIIKNPTADPFAFTIVPSGIETIDLAPSLPLAGPFVTATLVSDGVSNWMVI
jgi:hypothetical protein